ncbi:phosphoribosyltransferase family protein [Isoptericola sp. b441]|uniref:Phosphoribosyltransferase family protein n=1 Tax=Actinotalea lenta TaxID=3064654 RepID=A0ABT9DBC5_9CELL|nr:MULTISPECIES: phosphoribosyltransferase family protein [unclassified Isoptericola]MDO8108198.1 phosphoribosyltransferase family protein [Isoptericola sp. b441]MDO8120131.1 phosphoribosyltransferase family protein [Isoptericola sp. b490]
MTFANRTDAGRRLATRLAGLRGAPVVVLALPRGGVPVAAPVAVALEAPLDVIAVRKLGVPWQPELAIGAIAEGGIQVVAEDVMARVGLTDRGLEGLAERERPALARMASFRDGREPVDVDGRTAVVIDDGLATGATARAACLAARERGARRVVLAVPVAPPHWALPMHDVADECIALHVPADFRAVGQAYDDFSPTTDEEVRAALDEVAADRLAASD